MATKTKDERMLENSYQYLTERNRAEGQLAVAKETLRLIADGRYTHEQMREMAHKCLVNKLEGVG